MIQSSPHKKKDLRFPNRRIYVYICMDVCPPCSMIVCVCPCVRSFLRTFVPSPVSPLLRSFARSFVRSYVHSFVPTDARALARSTDRWFESSLDGGRTNSRTYSNSEVVLNGSIVRAFERSHGPAEPCELEYVLLFGRPWRNILFAQILKPLKFYTPDFESSNRSYF